ncbi:MAG: GNAT family N-acetyltransferase [Chitinophagales bacterium]
MKDFAVLFAHGTKDFERCSAALRALRPHLSASLLLHLLEVMTAEGAKVIFIDVGKEAPAVAVFRINHFLYRGKNLYVDDLITLPEFRGKGYATALLRFMEQYAREQGCENIHLDSGYQAERYEAHRLYLNHGYHLASHHFVKDLLT